MKIPAFISFVRLCKSSNTPQDQLGTYSVQAGDSLDQIAFQVYGDSSLWYLIADANGLSDRQATSQLHNGQRLIIPSVATGQHFNTATHRVLSSAEMIGDTSATLPTPALSSAPAQQRKKHNSIFKKIAIAAVSVVATVLAAAAFASLAGAAMGVELIEGLGGFLDLGMKVLAGHAMGTMAGTLTAGFAAGVAGSLAGQGLANILGLQKGLDLKGSLISGLSTAASAGILQGLNASDLYSKWIGKIDELSPTGFSLSTATQMMEQDTVNQGLNLALQKQQHFDWAELGSQALLGGLTGSLQDKKLSQSLAENLGEGGGAFLHSELSALATGGLQSALSGKHFDAGQVLANHLGSAMGSGLIQSQMASSLPVDEQGYMDKINELYLSNQTLDPAPSQDSAYQNYLAQQLANEEDYNSLKYFSDKVSEAIASDKLGDYWGSAYEDLLEPALEIEHWRQIKAIESNNRLPTGARVPEDHFLGYGPKIPSLWGQNSNRLVEFGNLANTRIDNTYVSHLGVWDDVALVSYESYKKIQVIQVLEQAENLHKSKITNVAKAWDLEKALTEFKTPHSQSYQILDKAINSKTYKALKISSKSLGPLYVGIESTNAFLANWNESKNVRWRETVSAAGGATTELVGSTAFAHSVGLGGGGLGVGLGGFGMVVGYTIGFTAGSLIYNYSRVSNYVNKVATAATRNTWNYVHDHIYWS